MSIMLMCGILIFVFSEIYTKKSENSENTTKEIIESKYFIFCAWLMNKNAQRAFLFTIILTILNFLLMALSIQEDTIEMIVYALNMVAGISFVCSIIYLL